MRKTAAATLLVLMAIAGNAFAGAEGRLIGKVTDAKTGQPIPNAKIHVSATEARKYEQDYPGDKDGTYKIFLVDATIRYKFTVSAQGYPPYEETIKLKIGETMTKDFKLGGGGEAPAVSSGASTAPKAADPATVAYNDGAKAYNDGKYAEAAAKFEEAVKAKPELIAGWEALARVDLKLKAYPKAIEAANKALDLAPDESDMYPILADAYQATGDKEKAAVWKKKLPMDAAAAFNAAAALINKNNDTEAEPLLKQSIAADEKFAPAYFELGMLYVRTGKMAEAKTNLETYLKLDPNGKNAATAKETLQYVK
jgi:tetratricopeptide (TPR) repeat protein